MARCAHYKGAQRLRPSAMRAHLKHAALPNHDGASLCSPDVCEEFVAEPLARRRALYDARDVHELERRRHHLRRKPT